MIREGFVFDTNAALSMTSVPGQALAKVSFAITKSAVLQSEATLEELREVLARPKFDAYSPLEKRLRFLMSIELVSTKVVIKETITDCRDPKDNKFLELAVAGNAKAIITGDSDLLVLHPFREIAIMSPKEFLDSYA